MGDQLSVREDVVRRAHLYDRMRQATAARLNSGPAPVQNITTVAGEFIMRGSALSGTRVYRRSAAHAYGRAVERSPRRGGIQPAKIATGSGSRSKVEATSARAWYAGFPFIGASLDTCPD
ncbi:hypothetical protein [Streptomyces goshikiensis]|uniref:hypothetical protein n=1 Tax=Streptomyces goshikiensis TaxID=1942 RepID=UPI00371BD6E5